MKALLNVAVLTSGLLALGPAQGADRTVTLAVENMTCASCPYIVKKSLAAMPGVSKAEVSFETKSAIVTFDDQKTSIERLTEATAKAGYPSKPKQ
jgi:mercuric ion binding protein